MICRELGFASPRHLFSVLTPTERNEWIAFFNLEAERMNPEKEVSPEEAEVQWNAFMHAQNRKVGG